MHEEQEVENLDRFVNDFLSLLKKYGYNQWAIVDGDTQEVFNEATFGFIVEPSKFLVVVGSKRKKHNKK